MAALQSRHMTALQQLASPGAPRVFAPGDLHDWLKGEGIDISRASITVSLQAWGDAGFIQKIKHGVYLNLRATPRPTPEEAAPLVRAGAIVSLQTVLGQSGVLNNPTPWVTCVYPYSKNPNHLTLELEGGTYRFTPVNDEAFPPPGDDWDGDAFEPFAKVPTATPEKALLDWLYLSENARAWAPPPAQDIDFDELDADRLDRLALRMDLIPALHALRREAGLAVEATESAVRRPAP